MANAPNRADPLLTLAQFSSLLFAIFGNKI
ncbi:hypothetical protein COLO4_17821 [Corchorus olitorius]|uniref:Uncharacterized protein n=1 Tax=Corchorus olitorius TaxID=93759 RepID=A0A1R3JBD7_9ROSI|nr:hypothetical protein COLO4_17821 [Corchorus olitorius]